MLLIQIFFFYYSSSCVKIGYINVQDVMLLLGSAMKDPRQDLKSCCDRRLKNVLKFMQFPKYHLIELNY